MTIGYTKVGPFVDDSSPYLSAANLNTIEQGIKDTADAVDALGSAAEADTGDFATAAQGSLADTAVQPADLTGESAVNVVAATGATETLSAASVLHDVTMDQNCTFTFTAPSAGAMFAVLLQGAFTPTFPASVDWPDGTPPTYSAPALYVFSTFNGGTTWFGVQSGKAFA